jgi:two-component system sensor histidine kinase RpfC
MVARLSNRPDSEHELTLSRLALSMVAFLALFIGYLGGSEEHRLFLEQISIYFIAFTGTTLFLFIHLLIWPHVSQFRRLLGIPIDILCVAYLMHSGDELTAFTYPIFLWAIFGNGFRFGVKYLFIAAIVGFFAFLAVIVTTPFWRENRELSSGLLAGLIILPVYVSILIRRLSEAKRQAEEASRAKSLFLASISHELRTPLNAVIGLSDMLAGAQLPREQSDMARTIGKSGRLLLNLINSLLDLSRMEIGNKPQMGVFALHDVLRDIRAMLDVQAQAKGIDLALHLDAALPRHVLGSMRHFEEVLINLAGNAVKFTTQGYVLIEARVIDETEDHMRLRIEVRDTGIGIAPEAQARIFESFTQADETIIDRFGGTGLGLTIARQLVLAHGGEIGVESSLGRGSMFWFEMQVGRVAEQVTPAKADYIVFAQDKSLLTPFEASGRLYSYYQDFSAALADWRSRGPHTSIFVVEDKAFCDLQISPALLSPDHHGLCVLLSPDPARVEPEMRRHVSTLLQLPLDEQALQCLENLQVATDDTSASLIAARPLRILVAEDNRTNQMVLGQMLKQGGHEVVMVENGDRAVDALLQDAFDLVLMDLNMPVMNGIDAAKFYSFAILGQESVPIIALTADATEQTARKCRDAGMAACLNKPIEPHALLEAVAKHARVSVPRADAVEIVQSSDAAGLEPVDPCALRDLEKLGGTNFVSEVVVQFIQDAGDVLLNLREAVRLGHVEAFRDHAHALRSCAANVGAQAVYRRCLDLRMIEADELKAQGSSHLRALEQDFETACTLLRPRIVAAA